MAVWSIISISQLGNASRMEAEYYKPEFLTLAAQLDEVKAVPLKRHLKYLTDGTHVTPKYVATGVPFLSSSDIDEFIPSQQIEKFISIEEHNRLKHCQPDAGDILMSKSGRIGSCAVVPKSIKRGDWNIYEGVALLRILDLDPEYVAAFLNSRYGYSQIKRELKGVAQPHLHLEDIRRLRLFVPSVGEVTNIGKSVHDGVELARQAHLASLRAKHLLESELRLGALNSRKPIAYESSFSELEISRRLDAQHYQPQFAALLKHLHAFATAKLGAIKKLNRRGVQPIYVSEGTIAVVNSQHLGPKHVAYDNLERTSKAYFDASAVAHIFPNDLLIYTTGAYIGRTNVYLSDESALASNHVNILRLQPEIDAAYMSLVMQSVVGQFQTQKHARGSAQAELYPSDIDKFVVPLLPTATQKSIGDLLRESLRKELESKRLLEEAKARVEQLIEEAVKS